MATAECLSSDEDDEAWIPREQRAACFQQKEAVAAASLQEVLQWRSTLAREEAERRALDEGGLFDFDNMPEPEPGEADPREPLAVPQGLDTQEKLRFVEMAERRAIEDENDGASCKTARQQIREALEGELKAIPLGDKRRRELRVKAAEDIAKAPADPPISRFEAKELGKLLCVLEREDARKRCGPVLGANGRIEQPPPALPILEPEAIELVKKGADVNIRIGDLKRLPLHAAAERCFPKLVEALLKARAEPNRADFAGETALHTTAHSGSWCTALQRDRILTVVSLVEGRADVNFANPRGRTPLHIAASARDGVVIKALLDEGADVNAGDLGGFTPLMWAAGRGGKREVEALLDAEADPTLQAKKGQTALLFALTNKHNFVVTMLEEHLAILDRAAGDKAITADATGAEAAGNAEENVAEDALAKPYKWPKQTLHFPYMGMVRQDCAPDMSSNVY